MQYICDIFQALKLVEYHLKDDPPEEEFLVNKWPDPTVLMIKNVKNVCSSNYFTTTVSVKQSTAFVKNTTDTLTINVYFVPP